MRKLTTILAAAALATVAACGATPTSSTAASPGEHQENTAQADTTNSRVPNLFGSGN